MDLTPVSRDRVNAWLRRWRLVEALTKLDGAVIGLEGAERDAAITPAQQGRCAPLPRSAEPADRVDVDGVCPRRQPRQFHVFSHLHAQRSHCGLPGFEHQAGANAPPPRKIPSIRPSRDHRFPYGVAVQSNEGFENLVRGSQISMVDVLKRALRPTGILKPRRR
jgi:hypothetical protein